MPRAHSPKAAGIVALLVAGIGLTTYGIVSFTGGGAAAPFVVCSIYSDNQQVGIVEHARGENCVRDELQLQASLLGGDFRRAPIPDGWKTVCGYRDRGGQSITIVEGLGSFGASDLCSEAAGYALKHGLEPTS